MGCSSSHEVSESGPAPRNPTATNPNFGSPTSTQEIKPVTLDKHTLERYVQLEQQIHSYEARNISKALDDLLEDDANAVLKLKSYEEELRVAKENVQSLQSIKEKSDVDNLKEPSIEAYLKSRGEFDTKMSKEEEEYVEALNKLDVVKKQIQNVENLKEKNKPLIEKLKAENEDLNKLYQEEDSLLASIFNGSYGSELEDALEQQLDKDLDRKQRVGVAKYKWNNAKVLIQYSVSQLGQSCKKWQMAVIFQTNPPHQIVVLTDVRNNLIAAIQNLTEAQKYLSNISFPYCKADEINTVNQAIGNIYTDIHHPDRFRMAEKCYVDLLKRAVGLLQWFDLVINGTINRDYEHIVKVVRDKEKLLRAERLRLIKDKIKAANGEDADCEADTALVVLELHEDMIETDYLIEELGFEDDDEPELAALDHHTEAEAAQNESQDSLTVDERTAGITTPQPSPPDLNDLEPVPANMTSDIEELRKQHDKDMEEYRRQQDLSKTRTNMALQEKLQQRRSRRKRQENV